MQKINSKKWVGKVGEQQVARQLQRSGFTIMATNYQIRAGEIDIIARKDETVAFVEVKTRTVAYFSLCQVVTRAKQKKIIKTARYYLAHHQLTEVICRFDVALVQAGRITYIPNAFTASE